MNKDFPSALFEVIANEPTRSDETHDLLAERQNLTKLNYAHPLTLDFDQNPTCLTQKFYFNNNLEHAKFILPWCLPNDFKKNLNYDIYSEINKKNDKFHLDSFKFYYAQCKNTKAKFYLNLFNTASQGKCFLTNEGNWLTPIEFIAYSGSTAADWKSAIILKSDLPNEYNQSRKRKKKHQLSIKKLTDNKNFKIDPITSSIQTENINLIDCFFMNSGKDLILLQPNITSHGILDIQVYESQLDSNLFDLLLMLNGSNLKIGSNFKQTFSVGTTANLKIKQIESKLFDDESNFFNGRTIAKDVKEAYVALNLNNSKLQMFKLDLRADLKDEYIQSKLLYEIETTNDYLTSMTASHLIAGESAVLLEKSGEILLLKPDLNYSKFLQETTRIAANLNPLFDSKHNWKSVQFGAQPRQFIYSDYSQVVSIDSRIKTTSNYMTKELFKLSTKYVDTNELINRSQVAENDYFSHLICCSKTLFIIDERYTKTPLMSWKHDLKQPAMYLENLNVMNSDNDNQHYVLISDSFSNYVYQYCTKKGMLISCNFPYKLDVPLDMMKNLPQKYDRRLDNFLKNRLNEPIIGFKPLKYSNSFALFQMLPNYDIFYQCYETTKNKKRHSISTETIYTTWLNEIQNQSLIDFNISLESDFNEMSLGNVSKTLPNLEHYLEASLENEENLNKYLSINYGDFTSNNVTKLVNYETIDLNQNELTQSLFSIWNENI